MGAMTAANAELPAAWLWPGDRFRRGNALWRAVRIEVDPTRVAVMAMPDGQYGGQPARLTFDPAEILWVKNNGAIREPAHGGLL